MTLASAFQESGRSRRRSCSGTTALWRGRASSATRRSRRVQTSPPIRAFGGEPNDWLSAYADAQVLRLIADNIDFSRFLQRECAALGLAYFDTSTDFPGTIDAAFRHRTAP